VVLMSRGSWSDRRSRRASGDQPSMSRAGSRDGSASRSMRG
jgi:hypothetical protein